MLLLMLSAKGTERVHQVVLNCGPGSATRKVSVTYAQELPLRGTK